MDDLTELREDLKEAEAIKKQYENLKQLKTNIYWKKLIDEGLFTDHVKDLVGGLYNPKIKEENLEVLTGISCLKQYLDKVEQEGKLAEGRIKDILHTINIVTEELTQ